MKKILFLLALVCSFASHAQKDNKFYGEKIVWRGLSQQGHWIYSPSENTTHLVYDSIYVIDITWRQAWKTTGFGRFLLKLFGTGAAVGTETALVSNSWAGATLLTTGCIGATAGIGAVWALAPVEDCRWNNQREITADEYWYDKEHYGSLKQFWDKNPLIR